MPIVRLSTSTKEINDEKTSHTFIHAHLSLLINHISSSSYQSGSCEFDPSAMSGNNASAHAFDQCQDQVNPLIANDANGSSQGAIINVNTTVQDGKTYLVYTIASSVDATSK